MEKNLPASVGDTGSIPGLGRFHMPWSNKAQVPQLWNLCSRAQELPSLSPCATTTEARVPRTTAMRSPGTETRQPPLAPTSEKTVQQQTLSTAKNKVKIKIKLFLKDLMV